ncbi:hypothetical protein Tco_1476048 [Tanacetum coccineum]
MTSPLLEQGSEDGDDTTPHATKEQIEGYLSALRSLVKEHNSQGNVSPIREILLSDHFDVNEGSKDGDDTTPHATKEQIEGYLSTLREWPMPVWCRMFQQTLDRNARGWFERLPANSIDGWVELREQFAARFFIRRAFFKDPTEITKIVRKANEILVAFKERWTVETGFIMGVSKVMKISSFMDGHKCPELAKRYSDKVPKTVDEMMVRLDDFVRSEEVFANTELPRGEASEVSKRTVSPISRREDQFNRGGYGADRRRNEGHNMFNNRDGLAPYRSQTPYQGPRMENPGHQYPRLNLNSLTKHPKEILALELQLNLSPPRPMQLPPKKENQDRYCDYHGEKGH